jgi:hypothetical protein
MFDLLHKLTVISLDSLEFPIIYGTMRATLNKRWGRQFDMPALDGIFGCQSGLNSMSICSLLTKQRSFD